MINTNLLHRRLFIIGNSHVHQFTGASPNTRIFTSNNIIAANLGAITAYKFGEKYLSELYYVLNVNNFDPISDIVITTIGEIDCRHHIPNQILNHGKPIVGVVQECAYRYFAAHIHLQRSIQNIKSVVMGVNPPHSRGPSDNEGGPVTGDFNLRNEVTKLFNHEIKSFCNLSKNIKYFDIYQYLLNQDGTVNLDFFYSQDDYVHYNSHKIIDYINIELTKVICS